ncbi:arsenate reductase family protein [Fervidibacillus albus]|uniref:Arsenate reductase family protein n=1 Tax=Fervidibacillus albus TaxID=2980026 RepID=A0A9E8RVY8_9BACI|nr:arsenate reductase family protein [Fervidibacillus albus]WAA11175.1 arsenate reductase family protein [Fervidibacillus albus]
MAITFYWYPNCQTSRKAKKWLEGRNIPFESVHIVENPPTREQLEELYKMSGLPLKKFFNTSGQKYRALGLKDQLKTMSEKEMLDVLATDGKLLKRPIVTDGKHVTVGFNEENFEKTWG